MKENIESKFSHNEKVKITNGYYKGYTGKVCGYDKRFFQVSIKVDEREESVNVLEKDLIKIKTWF